MDYVLFFCIKINIKEIEKSRYPFLLVVVRLSPISLNLSKIFTVVALLLVSEIETKMKDHSIFSISDQEGVKGLMLLYSFGIPQSVTMENSLIRNIPIKCLTGILGPTLL